MSQNIAPFIKPDDFVPIKGRGKLYACKLCVPEGKARGVPMKLPAALRHERQCEKHLEKVKEAAINDWTYVIGCDWGPAEMPKGSTAWEESCAADRVEDFVHYWMDNIEAAGREAVMETMDSFIDRFNQRWADWLKDWKEETESWKKGQGDAGMQEAEPAEECDGVKGWWYSGGSFDPRDDGLQAEEAKAWGVVPEDPYEVWGISRDEITPWTDVVPAPVQQVSDATPPERSPKATYRRNDRGKGRAGRSGQKQPAEGRRNPRAKIH